MSLGGYKVFFKLFDEKLESKGENMISSRGR